MSMNYAHDADRGWIDLVIDAVGEASQQHAPQVASDDWLTLRPFLDEGDGVVNCVEEMLGSCWRAALIPLKGRISLSSGDLADPQPAYLAKLLAKLILDIWPRLTRLRGLVGLGFAAIQLGGQRRRDGSGGRGVQTIPELTDEGDALFGGQIVQGKRTGH